MTDKVWARIVGGAVFELVNLPDDLSISDAFHADLAAQFVDATGSGAKQGYLYANGVFSAPPPPVIPPRTLFSPREIIETLFTAGEQQAIFTAAQTPAGWQMAKFIALVTATPMVDITADEFVADVGVVQAAGLLTSARAAQVLAGTPADA